jgi:succinate dehydrogenase / fumarate reductase membrane anchor subunit
LDYEAWRGLFAPLTAKLATWLFIAALLVHAWIGMREIIIDYVHCQRCLLPRLSLYFVFGLLYLACLVWATDILWSVK